MRERACARASMRVRQKAHARARVCVRVFEWRVEWEGPDSTRSGRSSSACQPGRGKEDYELLDTLQAESSRVELPQLNQLAQLTGVPQPTCARLIHQIRCNAAEIRRERLGKVGCALSVYALTAAAPMHRLSCLPLCAEMAALRALASLQQVHGVLQPLVRAEQRCDDHGRPRRDHCVKGNRERRGD